MEHFSVTNRLSALRELPYNPLIMQNIVTGRRFRYDPQHDVVIGPACGGQVRSFRQSYLQASFLGK